MKNGFKIFLIGLGLVLIVGLCYLTVKEFNKDKPNNEKENKDVIDDEFTPTNATSDIVTDLCSAESEGAIYIDAGRLFFENIRGIEYSEAKGIVGTPKKILSIKISETNGPILLAVLTEEKEVYLSSLNSSQCSLKTEDQNKLLTFVKLQTTIKIEDIISRKMKNETADIYSLFAYTEAQHLKEVKLNYSEDTLKNLLSAELGQRWGELFPKEQ